MTVSMHRVLVALKRPPSAPDLLVFATAVVNEMNGNSWFPAPVPSLASVRAADPPEGLRPGRFRREPRFCGEHHRKRGVERRGARQQAKAVLGVLPGRVSGSVRLAAKAVAKVASYEWQLSKDAGKTWLELPKTLQAKTAVSGLTPGMTYGFRFRAGVRADPARAVTLYQRACNDGEFPACSNLGRLYALGQGVERDDTNAVLLFRRACDGGNAGGCGNLGSAYQAGVGVARDRDRATELHKRACDGGATDFCTSVLARDDRNVR